MVKTTKYQKNLSTYILDCYCIFSFVVGAVIFSGGWFFGDHFLQHGFFASVFLVGSYYFFTGGMGHSDYLQETSSWPGFFLLQIVSLIGISYLANNTGGLYLSLVPIMFGFYFFANKETHDGVKNTGRPIAMIVIAFLSYMIFAGITKRSVLEAEDAFYIAVFAFWSMSIIYWGYQHVDSSGRSFFGMLVKSKNEMKNNERDDRGEWPRDRLFFHDLINQTHGINLYLGQKIATKSVMEAEDIKVLRDEVKVIQSLVKDHYGYSHRNLFNVYEFVTFEFAKNGIYRMVRNFLPEYLVDCHFIFKGRIADGEDGAQKQKCLIHYPSFYRIMINLIKNISEVKTDEVEFVFDYTDDGLEMVVRNKVCYLKDDSDNLAKNLGEIILGHDLEPKISKESGLGLESISSICKEQGGKFTFLLEGGYWINRISLPNPYDKRMESEDFPEAA
ncbi:MAG: hypothetical protein KAQ98_06355 [Bacteriovoracaceae bacterium]|nr:hypothetical protein [Bacteriovoracaceae bacterium]